MYIYRLEKNSFPANVSFSTIYFHEQVHYVDYPVIYMVRKAPIGGEACWLPIWINLEDSAIRTFSTMNKYL